MGATIGGLLVLVGTILAVALIVRNHYRGKSASAILIQPVRTHTSGKEIDDPAVNRSLPPTQSSVIKTRESEHAVALQNAEQLVTKYWSSDDQSKLHQAIQTLGSIREETGMEWDDADDADDNGLTVCDYIEPLRRRGCNQVELLAAFYDQTGLRLGTIMRDVLVDIQFSPDDMAAAMRLVQYSFDEEELDSLAGLDQFDDGQVFQFAKLLGLSAADVINLYHRSSEWSIDEETVPAIKEAGYSELELLSAIDAMYETYGELVKEALEASVSHAAIAAFLNEHHAIDLEDLDQDLRDNDVAIEDRVKLLFPLIETVNPPDIEVSDTDNHE